MAQMVDSSQQKLKMEDIIKISAANTKSPYNFTQVYVSIMKELTLPGSIVIQKGNTIFLLHRVEKQPRIAIMRALNADIGPNYLKNSEAIVPELYDQYGFDTVVVQFTDPTIINIFKYIGRKRPGGLGYIVQKSKDNKTYQVTAKLGPPRG